MRRLAGLLTGAVLAALLSGCAPLVVYQVDMQVDADGEVRRRVRIAIQPDPALPGLRPRLADYLALPAAGDYSQFNAEPTAVAMTGFYDDFNGIPADLRLKPPAGGRETRNRAYQRVFDVALFKMVDYEEIFEDGVDRYAGESALAEFWPVAGRELMALAESGWGADYDLSELGQWLTGDGWRLAHRLYGLMWEIRRARRGGIAGEAEADEAERRLWLELRRFGVETVPASTPEAERINRERLEGWLDARLAEWFRPRRPEAAPPRVASFMDREERAKWQKTTLEAVRARYGSLEGMIGFYRPWVPKFMGNYALAYLVPAPTLAKTRMSARWRLPGWALHTNGYRDFDGALRWDFSGREAALAGYTMWARTVVPNPEAMRALRLTNFPDSLATMERYVSLLFREDRRTTRTGVVAALRRGIQSGSLQPLRDLSETTAGVTADDVETARTLAALLERHQKTAPPDNSKP